MHPAPSVILFTVLSGMGFGALAFLGLGLPAPVGWVAFFWWGLAYALAVGGLLASTFHLGHPERFLKALTQWQSSWLSREGIAAIAALLILAPVALSDILGLGLPRLVGQVGAVLCLATIFTTSMIYAQLRTVPRWHSWTTPALFLTFMATGGALLTGNGVVAGLSAALMLAALLAAFRLGDTAFARAGQTLGKATGLDRIGRPQVFEQPHTSPNYLMREMIHVVGRKHVARLRAIALIAGAILPGVLALALPAHPATFAVAALIHLTGALAARWLFFAEAEHVVGLYYGKR